MPVGKLQKCALSQYCIMKTENVEKSELRFLQRFPFYSELQLSLS